MTSQELIGRFTTAIEGGDTRTVRELWASNPRLLEGTRLTINDYLEDAVECDRVDMLALLVELGADVHAGESESEPEGIIYQAANANAEKCVRWLLDQGVAINHVVRGTTRCLTLTSAVRTGNLALVKMLVEAGAEINATWMDHNALSFAIVYNQPEIEDYLRSQGAQEPGQPEADAVDGDAVLSHMAQHFGPSEPLVLQSLVTSTLPVSIHAIDLGGAKLLFTSGMSAAPMHVPPGGEKYRFAELAMVLPGSWPLDRQALKDPNHAWPLRWLLRIAHYPHDNNTWLGDRYAIISNKEPPRPFAPNTEFSCMLLLLGNKDYTWFELPSGDRGCFYELTPLYTEERDLKKREGINALVQALDDHQVTWQMDTSRPNVAK